MDFSNYSIEIRTITDDILTKGASDSQACLELCQSQGNVTVALDQYLLGLKIGKRHNCEYEMAMIYNNLGQLYMRFEEFDRAINYFLEAERDALTGLPNRYRLILNSIMMER